MKKFLILLFIVIAYTSCNSNSETKKTKQTNVKKEIFQDPVQNEIEYLTKADEFVKDLLGEKLRKHVFNNVDESPKHITIFPKNGVERIIAYSNKDYPKFVKPSSYHHFTLFCIEYSSVNLAKSAYINFSRIIQRKFDEIDPNIEVTDDWVETIHARSKPGGFIVHKGKYIFSLVESCMNPPIGKTWIDYENTFLSYLKLDSNEIIDIINADCGEMKYKIEKR